MEILLIADIYPMPRVAFTSALPPWLRPSPVSKVQGSPNPLTDGNLICLHIWLPHQGLGFAWAGGRHARCCCVPLAPGLPLIERGCPELVGQARGK